MEKIFFIVFLVLFTFVNPYKTFAISKFSLKQRIIINEELFHLMANSKNAKIKAEGQKGLTATKDYVRQKCKIDATNKVKSELRNNIWLINQAVTNKKNINGFARVMYRLQEKNGTAWLLNKDVENLTIKCRVNYNNLFTINNTPSEHRLIFRLLNTNRFPRFP